jgi:hypothetical protein
MSKVSSASATCTVKINVSGFDKLHLPGTNPPLFIDVEFLEIKYARSSKTSGVWEIVDVKTSGMMVRFDGSGIGSHPTDFHFDNHELLNTWVSGLAFRFSPTETGPRCVSG